MAVTVERLVAQLEARIDKYQKSIDKALGHTNRQFTAIERRGKTMETRLARVSGNIGRSFRRAFCFPTWMGRFGQSSVART